MKVSRFEGLKIALGMLPMWECCQCQCCQLPMGTNGTGGTGGTGETDRTQDGCLARLGCPGCPVPSGGRDWENELRCCATRDHEPRRGEGSALPIRLGLAATWLETPSFALCATEESRRCRRVPAAHPGFFAAPGHETPPSRRTKFHEIRLGPNSQFSISSIPFVKPA